MKRFSITRMFLAGAAALTILAFAQKWLTDSAPLDVHLHDTYFVIAHFHVVMAMALMLLALAGIYFVFSTVIRRPLYYGAGLIHFLCTFGGLLLLLLPVHYEGVAGMPRRYYDYTPWESFSQFAALNHFVSVVVVMMFFAQLLFFGNILACLLGRRP